jgi:hypothetical protein
MRGLTVRLVRSPIADCQLESEPLQNLKRHRLHQRFFRCKK